MLKQTFVLLFVSFISFTSFSQEELNNYKYIIVPQQFEFSKSNDQYQLNSLLEFLFNKYGYTAFLRGKEFPKDLVQNRCLALTADASKEKSGLFKTKVEIILKNCNDQIVITSKLGESRDKEYAKAYNLAIRDAFETFQFFDYKYEPKNDVVENKSKDKTSENIVDRAKEEEIKKLKQEIETLKNEKEEVVVAKKPVPQIVSSEPQSDESIFEKTLYAQEIDNGFQLVDNTPKVVMILVKTARKDTFFVKGKSAIVYKENGTWFYSENEKAKPLKIKF